MSTLAKVLIGLFGTAALFVGVAVFSVIGYNNTLVRHEAGIEAQYKQNQNNYDNYIKKVAEVAQVPAMQRDDLAKVYKDVMIGRYGKDGSKAMFNWIKEQNPKIDSSVYVKIQQIIESGRNSFEADQKMLLDKKRVYEIQLKEFPGNVVASILGFPKIDLAKYDIVTSDDTDKVFKTKKSKPLKLRE